MCTKFPDFVLSVYRIVLFQDGIVLLRRGINYL